MNVEKVTLYGAEYCPACLLAKKYLDEKKIFYSFINIQDNPQDFIEKVGEKKIPVLFIGKKKIIGFDQETYDSLFNNTHCPSKT